MDIHKRLSDHRLYQNRIDKLHQKWGARGSLTLGNSPISLASAAVHSRKFSKLLAKAVATGTYQPEPAIFREIEVGGKSRRLFSYGLTDTIVLGAASDLIEGCLEPHLSPHLFSYRRGISWWTPGSKFASFIRDSNKRHSSPLKRGLFVIRRDVDSYTDTIPVGEASSVWDQLRDVLGGSLTPSDWNIFQSAVRPVVKDPDGNYFSLVKGVPTGQPISCVLFNLYLGKLDRCLGNIPGGFYARYCDDIIFAHPSSDVVEDAAEQSDQILTSLGLKFNEEKAQNLFLNVAGRPSCGPWECRGSSHVEFVGLQVLANGTIRLSRRKLRALLRELEGQAIRTAQAMSRKDIEHVGNAVCGVLNRSLRPGGGLFQQRFASLVRKAITDREQLAQLDYQLARIVLKSITGHRDVRDFRSVPYKKIRQEWGLISLLHSRNRYGRITR